MQCFGAKASAELCRYEPSDFRPLTEGEKMHMDIPATVNPVSDLEADDDVNADEVCRFLTISDPVFHPDGMER